MAGEDERARARRPLMQPTPARPESTLRRRLTALRDNGRLSERRRLTLVKNGRLGSR